MYAAVPCYKLGRLHKEIRDDLPPVFVGLVATWGEIIRILQKQKVDPTYQYLPTIPVVGTGGASD